MKKTWLGVIILIVVIIGIGWFIKQVDYNTKSRMSVSSTNVFSAAESQKYQQKAETPAVVSKEKAKKSTASVDRQEEGSLNIEINGQVIPLLFESQGVDRKTKEIITKDIELVLSQAGPVEWVSKSSPEKLRGFKITHKLHGLDKERSKIPEAIGECIETGVKTDGVIHLLVPRQLVSVYRQSLEQKEKHPQMYDQLDDFIKLLENKKKLRKILNSEKKAQEFVYCYNTTLTKGLDVLGEYASIIEEVFQPSLLDIKPLNEIAGSEIDGKEVFVVSTVIIWQRKNNDPKHKEKLPIGAYVDGEWHVFSFPMP